MIEVGGEEIEYMSINIIPKNTTVRQQQLNNGLNNNGNGPTIVSSHSKKPSKISTYHIFSERTIQLLVKKSYTVWMVKVLLFEKLSAADAFDPTTISLYNSNQIELLVYFIFFPIFSLDFTIKGEEI